MRLIDADALKENMFLHEADDTLYAEESYIDNMPTIDAVQVVRCKDCKWYKEGYDIDGKWFSRCNGSVRTYGHTPQNWYCADGVRKVWTK